MSKPIKSMPIAASAIMLGTASLGNLLYQFDPVYKYIAGVIAFIIWILIISKLLIHRDVVYKELEKPGNASIAPTLTMGTMVLLTYIHPLLPMISSVLWYIMVILQLLIICVFTYHLVIKDFDFKNVVPGWFVMYVGTGIIPVTAAMMNKILIGQIFFGFSLIMYIIILPVILYRIRKLGQYEASIRPSLVIFAAPASLCLTGYTNVYTDYSIILVSVLIALALIMYIYALYVTATVFLKEFYPTLAALTFPFVISATALTGVYNNILNNQIILIIAQIETVIATVMIIYVIIRYVGHVVKTKEM